MTVTVVHKSPVSSDVTQKKLADWHVSMISVGGIIGAGLFIGTSATISAAGPAVLASYLLAGALVWVVMILLGRLARYHKGQGSFISHISGVLGQRSGFVAGWSYAFLWVVTGGAQAVAGGLILNDLFAIPAFAGSAALIVLALLLNTMPVRAYGKSEVILSVLKLLSLTLFVGLGVYWFAKTPDSVNLVHANLMGHGGFFPFGLWAVPVVVPMIVQTFTGCEIAFVASAESDEPEKNIRRTVLRVPFLVLLFYLGSVLVILCLRPWTDVHSGHSPFLLVMDYLAFPFAGSAVIIMTLVAVISCLNSSKYVVSRVLRELSDLGCAPARLAYSSRYGVPLRAVALSTVFEVLIVLSAVWSPSHVYAILLGASGTLILFVYFMVSLSCLRLSRAQALRATGLLASISALLMGFLFLVIPLFPESRLDGLIAFVFIALATGVSFRVLRSSDGDCAG